MPTVFVYEYCCAVGAGGSLGREGRAMRDAVAADFGRLPGVTVTTLDAAGAAEPERFRERVAGCDAAVVVAPEFDGLLADRCRRARAAGRGGLLSDAHAVELAADKHLLCGRWLQSGVRTPPTRFPGAHRSAPPAVWKPRWGAGSDGVRLVRATADEPPLRPSDVSNWVVQPFAPGRAASVAFLVGPRETLPLVPTFQHLSGGDRFDYLGGELPIPPELAARAVALGRRAVGCVPGLRGFVGVDLVLGDAADGSADYAIEINPRLTTSYVGLRALAETNLAGAMLAVCAGEPVELRWKPGRVRFAPDGAVTYDPTGGVV